MSEFIKLKLISEENREVGTYDERERTYECPCSEGVVVCPKKNRMVQVLVIKQLFLMYFGNVKNVRKKYNFMSGSAYLKKNHKRKVVIISNH